MFVCQNNQWAISVPLKKQTHSRTIAQKALAYGFPGIQVDGNDVLAVYAATKEAVDRARAGDGPTLIECVTYRLAMHTTADDLVPFVHEPLYLAKVFLTGHSGLVPLPVNRYGHCNFNANELLTAFALTVQ